VDCRHGRRPRGLRRRRRRRQCERLRRGRPGRAGRPGCTGPDGDGEHVERRERAGAVPEDARWRAVPVRAVKGRAGRAGEVKHGIVLCDAVSPGSESEWESRARLGRLRRPGSGWTRLRCFDCASRAHRSCVSSGLNVGAHGIEQAYISYGRASPTFVRLFVHRGAV
jgi:hypothetical protein